MNTTHPAPHIDAYYVAGILDDADDRQFANIIRRVAAERDLAVAALRRIRAGEAGMGDAGMIAQGVLAEVQYDAGRDASCEYGEMLTYLERLKDM